jgi:hypothetical protein
MAAARVVGFDSARKVRRGSTMAQWYFGQKYLTFQPITKL